MRLVFNVERLDEWVENKSDNKSATSDIRNDEKRIIFIRLSYQSNLYKI